MVIDFAMPNNASDYPQLCFSSTALGMVTGLELHCDDASVRAGLGRLLPRIVCLSNDPGADATRALAVARRTTALLCDDAAIAAALDAGDNWQVWQLSRKHPSLCVFNVWTHMGHAGGYTRFGPRERAICPDAAWRRAQVGVEAVCGLVGAGLAKEALQILRDVAEERA